jgi:hypothetical protein
MWLTPRFELYWGAYCGDRLPEENSLLLLRLQVNCGSGAKRGCIVV